MKKTDYGAELKKEYGYWNQLFCEGGRDPFWPDGVNLNLIRNHIIACKIALGREDREKPEEYGWPLPPELSPDYMARKKEIWYRGIESYQKYITDDNYLYLKEVTKSLPVKVKKESSIENVLGYEKAVRMALEQEDYVALRSHEHPEKYLESFARCRKCIEKLMEKEEALNQEKPEREKKKDTGQKNLSRIGAGRTR